MLTIRRNTESLCGGKIADIPKEIVEIGAAIISSRHHPQSHINEVHCEAHNIHQLLRAPS